MNDIALTALVELGDAAKLTLLLGVDGEEALHDMRGTLELAAAGYQQAAFDTAGDLYQRAAQYRFWQTRADLNRRLGAMIADGAFDILGRTLDPWDAIHDGVRRVGELGDELDR